MKVDVSVKKKFEFPDFSGKGSANGDNSICKRILWQRGYKL